MKKDSEVLSRPSGVGQTRQLSYASQSKRKHRHRRRRSIHGTSDYFLSLPVED